MTGPRLRIAVALTSVISGCVHVWRCCQLYLERVRNTQQWRVGVKDAHDPTYEILNTYLIAFILVHDIYKKRLSRPGCAVLAKQISVLDLQRLEFSL